VIDVDRNDEEARVIDPYFFARRIGSVCKLAWPEMRLWRWMPSDSMIVAALADLREGGVLLYPKDAHLFVLADALEERLPAVTRCRFDDDATRERWARAFQDGEDDGVCEAHRAWVADHARDSAHAFRVLDAARAVLDPAELADVCLRLVGGPAGPSMGKALEVLRETDSRENVGAISALLERLSPVEDPPYPAYQALAYLLERDVDGPDVARQFATFAGVERAKGFKGNPFLGQYAVLALRFLPAQAMGLVRRALRSDTPISVIDIAALLAAVGRPWCVRELTSALAEIPGASTIAEALRRCSGELARRRAAKLYEPQIHDDSRVGFTHKEVAHANASKWFEEPLRGAHAVTDEIRARYPDGWEG
jgi:hypothetical protein